jgi:fibronectin type 3 domain-containing protein
MPEVFVSRERLSAATVALTPDAPGRVATSSSSPTTATVTWNAVPGNTGFRIERAAGSGGFSILTTTTADATSFDDTGLTTGVTYRYRVSTLAGNQVSGSSPVASITPVVATNLAAPQNLSATNPSSTQVRLSWTGTNSSQAVLVQRSLDGGLTWSNLATVSGSSTGYTDTVQRNTLYSYRLRASTFTATSPFTGSVSLLTPPPEVTGLFRTAISKDAAELRWNASSGATGYVVEQSRESGPYEVIQQIPGGTVTTTIEGLETGTVYQYRVRATNAGGSSLATQLSGVLTIPAAPTGLFAEQGDGSTVLLQFTGTKGATSYIIERQTDGRPFARLVTLNAATTTYTDVQVLIGESYEYRVKAVNESGDSEYSALASVAVTLAGSIPVPDNLSLSVGPKNATVLNWTLDGNVDSFMIERQVGGNWRPAGSVPGTARSAVLKGLSPGVSARFRVVGATGGAIGEASDDILAMTVPATTSRLRVLPSSTPGAVALTWAAPRGATAFTIQRTSDRGLTYTTLAEDFVVAGFVDETAQPGQTYGYRAFSSNDAGDGLPSPVLSVITSPRTPGAVSANQAVAPARGFQVSWGDVEGELTYRVQGSIDGVKWSNAATARANVTTATVRNTKFQFFRVAAQNRGGISPFSAQVSAPVTTAEVRSPAGLGMGSPFSGIRLTPPADAGSSATDELFA